MIRFSDSIRVYASFDAIDFRRGLDGLLSLIQSVFSCDPREEYLFLFFDRSRKKIKAVFFDKNGFVLLYKRLEVGKFQVSKNQHGKIELNRLQLECLLSGMSFMPETCVKPNEYSVFS
jgi:transposase